MTRLYYRLLLVFAAFLVFVNAASFLAGFDARQIYNPFFTGSRFQASVYLIKNIIVDTGVHVKLTPAAEIDSFIKNAALEYGTDETLLRLLVNPDDEYSIGLAGGMGLTSISPYFFNSSGFSDPFDASQNIKAAAAVLKKLYDEGVPAEKLPERFLAGKYDFETIRLFAGSCAEKVDEISSFYKNSLLI